MPATRQTRRGAASKGPGPSRPAGDDQATAGPADGAVEASITPSIFGPMEPLPRGPHRLSREQVRESQRARLLAAISELVGEVGWSKTTLGAVARKAGVSPSDFYEHFADKEDCFLTAYDIFIRTLLDRVEQTVWPAERDWHDFVAASLDAYLGTLAESPALARAFLIEINALGPRARSRRRNAYDAFAGELAAQHARIREADPSLGPLPEAVYRGFVHAIRGLVCDALEQRGPAGEEALRSLGPAISRWLLATVQGAAAAAEYPTER